jgi:hypothetical protein
MDWEIAVAAWASAMVVVYGIAAFERRRRKGKRDASR